MKYLNYTKEKEKKIIMIEEILSLFCIIFLQNFEM